MEPSSRGVMEYFGPESGGVTLAEIKDGTRWQTPVEASFEPLGQPNDDNRRD